MKSMICRRLRTIGSALAAVSMAVAAQAASVSSTETITVLNQAKEFTKSVSQNAHTGWYVDTSSSDTTIATATMVTDESASTKSPTVSVTGLRNGSTSFTIRYPNGTGSPSTWKLTVKVDAAEPPPPAEFDYKGHKIAAFGAEQVAVSGSDDLVLMFAESGSLTVPADLIADILVVGGGGGGGAGSGSSRGGGGNGGDVAYRPDQTIAANKDLTVSVGAGGSGATGSSSSGSRKDATAGGRSSFDSITAGGGAAGSYKGNKKGSNGNGYAQYDITGPQTYYGAGGGSGSGSSVGEAGAPNSGNGGQGGGTGDKSGGNGGSGVVIVRFTGVVKPRTPVAVPAAATGLVWGMTNQVGVAAGEGYVRGGTWEASAVGEYVATVTPDDNHCWTDLKRDTKEIRWSIARRPAKVTVIDATKAPNDPEPYFHTRNEGFLAADQTELVWTAWRTNTSEEVGIYDIVILGETEQSGYDITYVGNTLTIENAPVGPSIPEDEGEITYDPATKEVVVMPKDATVTEVEIINMPADGTVKVPVSVGTIRGVEAAQVVEVFYTAPAGAGGKTYDITAAFTISGDKASGVTIALDEAASVVFDLGDDKAETIPVTPTLTETGDETVEPFEVTADKVDVGVKTIPGLAYGLRRALCLVPGAEWDDKNSSVVDEKRAVGPRTKLTDPMDGGKPEQAFYIIEVRK